MNAKDDYLNIQEAAKRLGYTRRHTRRLVKNGKLEGARKIKGLWLISRSSILYFKTKSKKTPVILPQEFSRVAINERVRDYGHIALASVTANYSRVVEELQDYLVHPERNQSPPPEKRIPFLRNLAAEYLPFIEQAVTDLKSLDVGDSKV